MPFLLLTDSAILLILLCCEQKKSRVFPILLFCLGTLIIVCCNEGNDFKALQFRYDYWYGIEEFPLGFQWILRWAKNIGLSFAGFKLAFGVFVFLFIYRFYRRYSVWPAICCAFAFIFPGDSFYGQLRNGISAVIVIFAIMYYYSSENKKSVIIFVGSIMLATIIHPSSIIYLGAILANRKMNYNKIIGFFLLLVVLFTIGFYSGLVKNVVAIFTHNERILRWLNVGISENKFGSISAIIGHVIWVIYIAYVRRMAYPNGGPENVNEHIMSRKVIDKIYNLNIISIILIPLYLATHNYFRLFKYILFINFLVVVQAAFYSKNSRRVLMVISFIILFSCYLISSMVSVGYREIPTFYNSFSWSALFGLYI